VLVTGMLIMWIRVRVRPMARPAKPAEANFIVGGQLWRNRLFGLANATWVVSENHGNALGAFREPLPSNEANPSNCKRFRQYVFTTNSGYRTRYPLVAGTTVCCAGRENSRSWQASIAEDLGVRLDMPLFAWQLIYPKMT
jgi:hypothetical protein